MGREGWKGKGKGGKGEGAEGGKKREGSTGIFVHGPPSS